MKHTWFERFARLIAKRSQATAVTPHDTPPERILTVWRKEHLHEGWQSVLDGFSAVSMKIVDGGSPYQTKNAAAVIKGTREAGLEAHGWGFHYCRDGGEAIKEGEAVAKAMIEHGLNHYHWNAEKQWAGGPSPSKFGKLFADTLRDALPSVVIYANCFHKYMTDELTSAFDVMEPMCYGTKITTIAKHWKRRVGTLPEDKRGVMCGTGRLEAPNSKRAWGYLDSVGKTPGLVALSAQYAPRSINWFRAGTIHGQDMMIDRNKLNPVLSEQANAIKEAHCPSDLTS